MGKVRTFQPGFIFKPEIGQYFQNQPQDYTQFVDTDWSVLEPSGWTRNPTSKNDIVTLGDEPYSAKSLRFRYIPPWDNPTGTYWPGTFTCALPNNTKEVYTGVITKKSSNWKDHITTTNPKMWFHVGNSGGGGDPFLIVWRKTSNQPRGTFQHGAQTGYPIPPGDGEPVDGTFYHNITSKSIPNDQWCHIECITIMNTDGENYDGEYHQWIDGVKVTEYKPPGSGIFWNNVTPAKWLNVKWEPLWGGLGGVIDYEFWLYVNHTRVAYKLWT